MGVKDYVGQAIDSRFVLKDNKKIYIYNFNNNSFPGMSDTERGYWRDVGSIDAYWQLYYDITFTIFVL